MTIEDLFEKSLAVWRANKAIGTEIIPYPLNPMCEVLLLLHKRLSADENASDIYIIVSTFSERTELIKFLGENEVFGNTFKFLMDTRRIKVWTLNVWLKQTYKPKVNIGILYKPNSIDEDSIDFLTNSRWKLVVLTKLLDNDSMVKLLKVAPLLDGMTKQDVDNVFRTSPVEESRIAVTIPEDSEDFKLLDKYNKYVQESLNIFGSFDVLEQARTGDTTTNTSAAAICKTIANENGWNENLDMSVDFNVQIDKYYNPMSIMERASDTYRIMRYRMNLLTDNKYKINAILQIVKDNINKKILIISKRGEFAKIVRDEINKHLGDICGCWLSDLESIPAVDLDGNPVYIKTGPRKGERKLYGAKMQSNQAEMLYNMGRYNVISTNNAPDKSLAIDVDIVIITSPMCETIREFQYRLSDTRFNIPIVLYSLYVKNTSEQKRLQNKVLTENHTIIKDCENDYCSEINYDEMFAY